MYPRYLHPVLVDTDAMPGTIYPQLQPPPPPFMPLWLIPPPLPLPPEPLPSATNVAQALDLSLPLLAEFASGMVMLMWHERLPSILAMHGASRFLSSLSSPVVIVETEDEYHRQVDNAASPSFKNFSRQILHATQLSESVVMLSLKYIAMVLHLNPSIQGADGSEYRVFTVALMLANKYLDDNTFTNKTWSEVTGMELADLNSMEAEFLDVLQYNLFVNKDEFGRWKMALVRFKNMHHDQQHHKPKSETIMSIQSSASSSAHHRQEQQQQHRRHYTFSKQPQFASTPPSQETPTRVPLRIPPPSSSLQGKPAQNTSHHNSTDRNDNAARPLLSKSPPYLHHHNSREDTTSSAFLSYTAPPAGQYVSTYPSYHQQGYLNMVPAMRTHYAAPIEVPSVYVTTFYVDPSAYAIPVIPSYSRRPSSATSSNTTIHNRH